MKLNRIIFISGLVLFVILGGFKLLGHYSYAAGLETNGASDAIAIRIVPNLNLYTIDRWYESRGFKGSPQSLTVDGYEAIRDGRTVYINAANISRNSHIDWIYNNIYIISYNQDPSPKTVDILGQVISKWKFNTNIADSAASICAISSLSCVSDTDCSSEQSCSGFSLASSSCVLKETKYCSIDDDCPTNFFCNSLKSRIIRDLRRVNQVRELEEDLFQFRQVNGHYPILGAGTYLANRTVSTWPSWSQVLLADLATAPGLVDQINRLGPCPGYDAKTCWNEETKSFPNLPTQEGLTLPLGSYAMSYQTDSEGSVYNICTTLEKPANYRFYSSDNSINNYGCGVFSAVIGGQATNTPPQIIETSLHGEAGQEFNGFIRAIDVDNNPLTWVSGSGIGASWSGWVSGGVLGAPPVLQDTNDPLQKKLYAEIAGNAGTKNFSLTITDSQGGLLATSVPVVITNNAPFIEAEDGSYVLSTSVPFSYSLFFSDNNITSVAQAASAYSATKISGPSGINLLSLPGIVKTITSVGINRYQVKYQGTIPTSYDFSNDTDFVYKFTVSDGSASSYKQAKITLVSEVPQLSFDCPEEIRKGKAYSCFIGRTIQDGHFLTYSTSTPVGQTYSGLKLVILTPQQHGEELESGTIGQISQLVPKKGIKLLLANVQRFFQNLTGRISPAWGAPGNLPRAGDNNPGNNGNNSENNSNGNDSIPGAEGAPVGEAPGPGGGEPPDPTVNNYVYLRGAPQNILSDIAINIIVTNEYGAHSNHDLLIDINSYCGDGFKQSLTSNTEGLGGYYNDGHEDCDGTQGVTLNVYNSGPSLQYGCRTGVGALTPYPIPNGNYCIFKSPIDGGGYCGDTFCQFAIEVYEGWDYLEGPTNCPQDCGSSGNCVPDCFNKQCGNDGCGNSCGSCDPGLACFNNQCGACGNGTCQVSEGENCQTCSIDCGCPTGEACSSGGVCLNPNHCGNGTCENPLGENCQTCAADCACVSGQICSNGACVNPPHCGNGTCQASLGENCQTCAADCGCNNGMVCCGNGLCKPPGSYGCQD